MTLRRSGKAIITLALCLICIFAAPMAAWAEEPHEDPAAAFPIYSGVALLTYYTSALDSVLQLTDMVAEGKLAKMPFAQIPPDIISPANDFAVSGTGVGHGIVRLISNITRLNTMVSQFRLTEVKQLENDIAGDFAQAYIDVDVLENTALFMGEQLGATVPNAGIALSNSYADVLDRIARIRQLLDSLKNFHTSILEALKSALEKLNLPVNSLEPLSELESLSELEKALEEVLTPTILTLEANPTTAFVGDEISFQGILSSATGPLSGREIDILLNGTTHITSVTEADGSYRGTLSLPYEYVDRMTLQALYYPRNNDIGRYLSAMSPAIEISVLFYPANLELTVPGKAYPGRETELQGNFIYDNARAPEAREIEVYLDNVLNGRATVGKKFNQQVMIPAQIEIGQHVLTVVAFSLGRYAPVMASIPLQVVRAMPIIDMNIPWITFLPGTTSISGKVYSELGPLESTKVVASMGSARTEIPTGRDGLFQVKIKTGLTTGLFGTQTIVAEVAPSEPWYSAATVSQSIRVLNWVNCGGTLIIFVCLSILIRRRMERRVKTSYHAEKKVAVVATTALPAVPATAPPQKILLLEGDKTPAGRLLAGYRWIVKLLINITGKVFRPQQTLREFSREVAPTLGPAAGFFDRLTRMVEMTLYSTRGVTEAEADEGKKLTEQVERRLQG